MNIALAAIEPSYVVAIGALVALAGYALYRLAWTQVVNPQTAIRLAALVTLATGFAYVQTNYNHPLALALAPVALVSGMLIGLALMRVTRFWRDEASGELWMRGGALYVSVYLAVLASRYVIYYAANGSLVVAHLQARQSLPEAIAADLLLVSAGLWIARAWYLVRRHRANERLPRGKARPSSATAELAGQH